MSFKQKNPANNACSAKALPLELIPGWVPVLRTAYAQIEFGALLNKSAPNRGNTCGSHDVVGEYAVYMMAKPACRAA
jgi:hypothetical protein